MLNLACSWSGRLAQLSCYTVTDDDREVDLSAVYMADCTSCILLQIAICPNWNGQMIGCNVLQQNRLLM